MKIIHFILGKANPNRMNGVNKVVNNLATTQCNMGLDVELWGVTDDLSHNYPERNYTTKLFKKSKNPFRISKKIRKELKNTDVTFHFHGGFIPQYFTMAVILKRHNIPFILTSHGSYNKQALLKSKILKKWYFNLFEKRIIKIAKQIHFIGKSEFNYIDDLVNNVNKVLIPNGQELLINSKIELNDKIIFGFCGRLNIHVKGLDILFEGFSQFVKESNKPAELWIIGGGDDFNKLIQLTYDYGIKDKVIFFGTKYGDDKNELISKMDYFCHTSRYEGLPTAVLEASALNVPSIVSAETNIGDYLLANKAGIVLLKNEAEYLCNAFKEVEYQTAEQRKEYGNNAIEMIKNEFSWETICSKLSHYYFN
jgi:glycosyltransferase involved in cell wall biosynthesis